MTKVKLSSCNTKCPTDRCMLLARACYMQVAMNVLLIQWSLWQQMRLRAPQNRKEALFCSRDYDTSASSSFLLLLLLPQVTADGTIIADDGSTASDVDAIIFATGFDVGASLQFKNISMQGLAGKDLNKTLASDPYGTYLGLAVSGFPNMFIMMGPNTWLGHNSVIFMMECGVNLIMKLLNATRKLGVNFRCLEVRESSQRGFSHEAQNRLKGSVWLSGGCSSWYLPQNNNNSDNNLPLNGIEAAPILSNDDVAAAEVVDGSKVACVMWVGSCVEYWWRTLWPRKRDWAVTTS